MPSKGGRHVLVRRAALVYGWNQAALVVGSAVEYELGLEARTGQPVVERCRPAMSTSRSLATSSPVPRSEETTQMVMATTLATGTGFVVASPSHIPPHVETFVRAKSGQHGMPTATFSL